MGSQHILECSECKYSISVTLGIGMMYNPDTVFFGHCHDPKNQWLFNNGRCEEGKPFLFDFVKDESIAKKSATLIDNGAEPGHGYGHELYICPQCMELANRFYFTLITDTEQYEPDYKCDNCKSSLQHIDFKSTENSNDAILIDENGTELVWRCPNCGGSRLVFGKGGCLWD